MTQSQHQHEKNLLQLCLAPRPSESRLDLSRRALRNDLDWEYIFQFAERQALAPLLHNQFKKIGADAIPAEYQQRFKLAYQANVARTLFLSDELITLTRVFESRGIESLPYKGPVLGQIAYGDAALRCFIDLDIIVRPADVPMAVEILLERGYRAAGNLNANQMQTLIANQHNIQFEREAGHLIVELHWRVSADLFASALNPESLWRSLEPVTLNNVQLKSLPAEDLLLALCIHGSRHVWDKLSQVCDIAALVGANQQMDWKRLMAAATEADAERMLLLGLCLAGELAEVSLPPDVQHSIAADRSIKRLAGGIMDRLFSDSNERLSLREVLRYNLLVRKSLAARLRYGLFALSPADTDLQALKLPRYLNFAYYGLRPFRLLLSRISKTTKSPAP